MSHWQTRKVNAGLFADFANCEARGVFGVAGGGQRFSWALRLLSNMVSSLIFGEPIGQGFVLSNRLSEESLLGCCVV